jgi:peptidoglycan DL-endopeptidase CwlO
MAHIHAHRRLRRAAHRSAVALITVGIVVGVVVGMAAGPAGAAPVNPTTPPDEGASNLTLGEALDIANAAYLQAQAALEASKKRQAQLAVQIAAMQQQLIPLQAEVDTIASASYRTGGLRTASAVLDADGPESFMNRSLMVQTIARYNDAELHRLNQLKAQLTSAKQASDAEVAKQQEQANVMAKKKADTEAALALAGGKATGGFVTVTSPVASPAPRAADGSFPPEKCVVNDPTTDGCITQRMLHALQETQKAGFKRFVSCHRNGGPFEHPKGRACDFSAQVKGFGGVAAGGDKIYGSNLAAFLVRNAGNLAVLYVIWFKQVWTPSAGWHSYSGQCGDPSCDHTNHVHLSVI